MENIRIFIKENKKVVFGLVGVIILVFSGYFVSANNTNSVSNVYELNTADSV
ncbi:MAG: hypothetical protein RL062_414, partial [Bacteroidota bacterium]